MYVYVCISRLELAPLPLEAHQPVLHLRRLGARGLQLFRQRCDPRLRRNLARHVRLTLLEQARLVRG